MMCCHLVAWCHFTALSLNPDCVWKGNRRCTFLMSQTNTIYFYLFFQSSHFFCFFLLKFNFVSYVLISSRCFLFSGNKVHHNRIILSQNLQILRIPWKGSTYHKAPPFWLTSDWQSMWQSQPKICCSSIRFILIRKYSSQWPISADCLCLFSSTLWYRIRFLLRAIGQAWRGVAMFISQVQRLIMTLNATLD